MKPIFITLLLIAPFSNLWAQKTQLDLLQSVPKTYFAQKITNPIIIDGKNDEESWQKAPWSDYFEDIEGSHKTKPMYHTRIKMLWDDQNLYIYARLHEPHIWGDIKTHDAIIYHNNDFEIFIKPFEHLSTYYEIEVNTLNTIMDLAMPKPYKMGGEAMMHWDTKNLQSAVYTEGTNNDPSDIDKYWAVEMAIPFTSLVNFRNRPSPQLNQFWRINFSRVQWQHQIENAQYSRKKVDSKLLPEENWVWSPIGIIDMHLPERWGFIKFVEEQNLELPRPPSYEIEKSTWNLYYNQAKYFSTHKSFASDSKSFSLVNFPAKITTDSTGTFYRAELFDAANKITTSIDNLGNYTIKYDR